MGLLTDPPKEERKGRGRNRSSIMQEAARRGRRESRTDWDFGKYPLSDSGAATEFIARTVAYTFGREHYDTVYHVVDYGFKEVDAAGKKAILEWSMNPNARMEDMPPGAMRYEMTAGILPGLGDLQAIRDIYRDIKHGEVGAMTGLDAASLVPGVIGAFAGIATTRRLGDFAKMGDAYKGKGAIKGRGMYKAPEPVGRQVKISPKLYEELKALEMDTFDPSSSSSGKKALMEALEAGTSSRSKGWVGTLSPEATKYLDSALANAQDIWHSQNYAGTLDPRTAGLNRSATSLRTKLKEAPEAPKADKSAGASIGLTGDAAKREDAIYAALLEGKEGEIPDPITGKPIRLAEERAQRYKTATADVDWTETEFANVTDMLEKLPPGRALSSMAVAGESARHWYRNSSLALGQMFGADAPRFTSMLAAMSPRTSVEQDFTGALLFWEKWNAADRPSNKAAIRKMLDEVLEGTTVGGESAVLLPSTAANNVTRSAMFDNAASVLASDDPVLEYLSGNKVNAFYNNLLQDLDRVTIDTWSSRYLGINNLSGTDRQLKMSQLATPEYRHLSDPRLQQTELANPRPERQGIEDAVGGITSRSQKYEAGSMAHREAADLLTRMTGRPWHAAEVQETAWSFLKTLKDHPNRKGRDLVDFWKSGEWTEADIGSAASFDQSVFDERNAPIIQRLVDQDLINRPEPLAGRPRGGDTDRSLARQQDIERMLGVAQDTYGDDPKYLINSIAAMAAGRYGAGLMGTEKPAEPQGQGGLLSPTY